MSHRPLKSASAARAVGERVITTSSANINLIVRIVIPLNNRYCVQAALRCQPRTLEAAEKLCFEVPAPDFCPGSGFSNPRERSDTKSPGFSPGGLFLFVTATSAAAC